MYMLQRIVYKIKKFFFTNGHLKFLGFLFIKVYILCIGYIMYIFN